MQNQVVFQEWYTVVWNDRKPEFLKELLIEITAVYLCVGFMISVSASDLKVGTDL